MIVIQYIPEEPADVLEAKYNSAYHSDMNENIPCELDGMDSWFSPKLGTLMKSSPWGRLEVGGPQLADLMELSLLAQFRTLKDTLWESDAVQDVCGKLQAVIDEHQRNTPGESKEIFCRLNECSMKGNTGGDVVPFRTARDIIRAFVEDLRVHQWFTSNRITRTAFHLSDFDPAIDIKKEYRVFIYRGRVTAISQYRWSSCFHVANDALMTAIAECIVGFVEGKVIPVLGKPEASFVADVFVEDEDPRHLKSYLIEINKFGGQTGCGSALFHWKRDEDLIYRASGEDVVIRVLVPTLANQETSPS
ncbi:uncharacterized protein EV422DRAFT_272580 [Fimicolochytrium jonesii]|uniref:uncharacterized protein n=1 Tax=Fimicolochytrium jonesii TaxID=1396493 RepID=UPI0022FF04C5|nr:uncharacterized protein EV422DRAFT_272580 [Fimicolochytrium jonesii]KAI8816863.1 hypothetical protein EV422DRAFT_272580 [Fimicolochytrium jonesii]